MKEIIVAERQDFIDVANAIRTKAGSNVQLSFPEGMIEAIENIKIGSSGGGSGGGNSGSGDSSSGGAEATIIHKWIMADDFRTEEMIPFNIENVMIHKNSRYTILISNFEEVIE